MTELQNTNNLDSNLKNKFFTLCVLARSIMAVGISITPTPYMIYLIIPATFLAFIGFYRYFTYENGQLGANQQLVWWNNNRLIHSLMVMVFILLITFRKYNWAKIVPYLDIAIGMMLVSNHYS
jgi:hypothetical protein